YFSFYIKNDEAYLKKTYKHYMEHQPQLPDTMYMEIKICDFELENYSENYKSIILKRFLDRLNKRIKSGEKNLQGIRNKFRNLPVKEFFLYETKNENYREAWTSYYQYEENWMLHYGLRLYAKIINK